MTLKDPDCPPALTVKIRECDVYLVKIYKRKERVERIHSEQLSSLAMQTSGLGKVVNKIYIHGQRANKNKYPRDTMPNTTEGFLRHVTLCRSKMAAVVF